MKTLAWSILILASGLAFGQPDFRFHRYGLDDGLPSPNVRTIAEDRYGQIWFGTNNGLAAFNGNTFTVFRNASGSQPGLASNDITYIFPLASGDLLIGTTAGLHVFDHKKQAFQNTWGSLPQSYISGIVPDGNGGYWIGSSTGLYHTSASDSVPEPHFRDEKAALFNTGIFGLYRDPENRLWITTSRKGFFKLSVGTNELVNYGYNSDDPASLSSNVMRQLVSLPDGRLVVGTADAGYNVFDPLTEKFTRFNHDPNNASSLSSTSAFSLLVDSKKNLWIGTWANGLNLIQTDTWTSQRFKNDPDNAYSVCSNSLPTLFESSTGDIWIGSNSGGVSRLTPAEQKFFRYRHDGNNPNSLTTPYVRAIHEAADGYVWFGTNQGGLNRYDPVNRHYTTYLKPNESRDALSRGTIWSISESKEGNIWFGTSRGVGLWTKKNDQITFLDYEADSNDPRKLSGNNVLKVLDDQQGNLWVGIYYGGLNRVDLKTGLIEKFRYNEKDPLSILSDDVNDIFIDSRGRLWVACDDGLNLYDRQAKTFKRYLQGKADPSIFHLNESSDGGLYLATAQGLAIFNPETGSSTHIGEAQGLGADHANSILVDNDGFVWLGTNNGIDRYDPKTGTVLHLNVQSGLVANDTEGKACFKSKTGRLYFAGTDGVTAFDPAAVFQDRQFPKIMFTGLSVFNKPVFVSDTTLLTQSIHTTDAVTLQYSDYVFALEFAALRFDQPANIRYAYQLQGFDHTWIYTNASDRKAVYTNVPPGTYTMKVKASNLTGEFSDDFIAMKIVVTPPWWKTWWARVLFYGSVGLILLLLIRGRVAFIKQQNRLLEKQVAERTLEVHQQKEKLQTQADALEKANQQKAKLFSIIAHDLRSPLNSLKALVTMLDPRMITASDLEMMKQEISKRVAGVSDVMDDLLTWSSGQLEIETLRFENVDVHDVMHEIADLYNPIASKKEITIQLQLLGAAIAHADINLLRAILRNLTSNALKFTQPGGTVVLASHDNQGELTISVKDSGVGMAQGQIEKLFSPGKISTTGTGGERGVGLGLLVVHDFIKKLNSKIWVESTPGHGTTFYFSLPPASHV